jgi:dephospho-CoA kinase
MLESPNDRAYVGREFLDRFGIEGIAHAIRQDLCQRNGREGPVIIDAIRFPETVRSLQSWRTSLVVFLSAPRDVRMKRLHQRFAGSSPEDRTKRMAAYLEYDQAAESVYPLADLTYENVSNLSELERFAQKIVG